MSRIRSLFTSMGRFTARTFRRARPARAPRTDAALMAEIAEVCRRAAKGDAEARILVVQPNTPLAGIALSINHMLDQSDAFVREAAAAMAHCSRGEFYRPILLRGLQGSYRQSAVVINAAGRTMRESATQLGRAAELAKNTAAAVAAVATACGQLDDEGRNIVRQVEGSSHETSVVVEKVGEARSAVEEMGGAARAGDAGRGFAVVAREVQDLANDVASATGQIGDQVSRMQTTLEQVVRLISDVSVSVTRVAESSATISHSVADQASATRDIASTIGDVQRNSEEVSVSIGTART